ncbi:hypothetical protein AK812_SmicGene47596, partial [Symbiodinium microadriaticum]
MFLSLTIALLSYVKAQRAALLQWLSSGRCLHAVFVRITDDTNVYVSPQAGPERNTDDLVQKLLEQDDPEQQDDPQQHDGEGKGAVGRTGRRKVMPLLGVLQWATVRRVGAGMQMPAAGELSTVQLHVPSQILPKANCEYRDAAAPNEQVDIGRLRQCFCVSGRIKDVAT